MHQTLWLQNKPTKLTAPKIQSPVSLFSFLVLRVLGALLHSSHTGSLLKLLSDSHHGCVIQEGSLLTSSVVEPAGTADWRTCMWFSLTPWLPPSSVARFQDQLIPKEENLMEASQPAILRYRRYTASATYQTQVTMARYIHGGSQQAKKPQC